MNAVRHSYCAAGLAVLAFLTGCTGDLAGSSPTPSPADSEPLPEVPLAPVTPVATVLQATLPQSPENVLGQIERTVKETQGVVSIARVGLGHAKTQSDSGSSDVSLVWADPIEFRPLAPSNTANAEFVWRGLMRGEVFLAHEDSRILAAASGARLFMQTTGGVRALRVGGVVSNGTPNLAGALISSSQAAVLRLAPPNLLLVGKDPNALFGDLQSRLKKALPSIRFDATAVGAGRAFLSGAESAKLFGTFNFTRNQDGSIVPDTGWVNRNIVTKSVPVLGSVRCHRLLIPQLTGALRELEQQEAGSTIDVADFRRTGGCYVPRLVRGDDPNRPISMHAWGLALDLNVARNPVGAPSNQDPRLVAAFERWGFRWGGRWSPPDAHHFELASLVKG